MDIIGADTAGAVVQTDQPAALPQSAAAPGAKKDGGGGVFGLMLARVAGNGEAGEEEGLGTDQRSADGADPASLAGLLVLAALPQSASPVPTLTPADAMDAGMAVALAGSLPRVPSPVSPTGALLQAQAPTAQLVPGADQGGLAAGAGIQPSQGNAVQLMEASGVRTSDVSAAVPIALTDTAPSLDQSVLPPNAPTASTDAMSLRDQSVSPAADPTVLPGMASSLERSVRTPASFEAAMSEDAGDAESGDESGPAPPGKNGVRTRFPSGGNPSFLQRKPGPDTVFMDKPSVPPLFTRQGVEQPAVGSSFADAPVAEVVVKAAGPGESGAISIQTANLDTPRPPATGHVSFGSERLAVESLSAPATLPPASVSAQAMPKDISAIHDPVPVAGSAFQRDMLQIQLAPTELGRITMQVSVHARQVQATVSVEHQGLGAYLVAGQGALDEAVGSHGLRVEEFRVDLLGLGAGRTGQGQDPQEFQSRQDVLPGRPESVAVPVVPAASPSEDEPAAATAPQRLNVFA